MSAVLNNGALASPAPSPSNAVPNQAIVVAIPAAAALQNSAGPRRSSRTASAAATTRIALQSSQGRRRLKREYQVQAIVDRRNAGRATEYLVKWVGYPASQNTWEPRRNLNNCAALVRKFNAALNAEAKAKAKK